MDAFRLYTGGPFGLSLPGSKGRLSSPVRIWSWAVLLWLPYVVSKYLETSAFGFPSLGWEKDFSVHVRLLFTIPIVIYGSQIIDFRISRVLQHLEKTNAAFQESFKQIIETVRRIRDSKLIHLFFIFIVLILLSIRILDLTGQSEWPRLHRVWLSIVGITLMQVLTLFWLARTALWTWVLWRLSRTELQVLPAHPDGRGGLAILNWMQGAFVLVTLAISTLLTADILGNRGASDEVIVYAAKVLGALLLTNLVVFLGPLVFFTPRLARVKMLRMMDFEAFSDHCSEDFESKWIPPVELEKNLRRSSLTTDVSVIGDLVMVDSRARGMKVLLPDFSAAQKFALACFFPLLPALVTKIPPEIWINILKKIFI